MNSKSSQAPDDAAARPSVVLKSNEKLAYDLGDAADMVGLKRDSFEAAVRNGHVRTFLLGRKRMVSHRALEAFIRRGEQTGFLDITNLGRPPKNTREGGATHLKARRTRQLRNGSAR